MSANELVNLQHIESRIFTVRGLQVMIDFHLADIYGVETKRINEQVKRNYKRFPPSFMFQLTKQEWDDLQSQFATTETNSNLQQLDLEKHNTQYPPIKLKTFANSHDRFLIIDGKELYHIGASLKDLGKKWFAFSRMDSLVNQLLNQLKEAIK